MYHFKSIEHAPETKVLNEHTELSGSAIKFLKDFQISAVRFLFEQFCKRDFSILNDESGLGKTSTVAVFLGIVAARKNCLIVVSNNDECILAWRFHLDILTELKVKVLNAEKDYDSTAFSIYIVKWNTLRTFGEAGKIHFDIVIADNREQILKNAFCISTLLKHFEKKVQVVISSVDVTADVKLLHNLLRLGGRLEHQFETYKAFELKFKLPDLKAISTKKSDLEDYFMRREILNDYCRDFRLRRYRYQYEHILPLVDSARYKSFLREWQETQTAENRKNAALSIEKPFTLPFEIGTEELLAQYQTIQTTPTPRPSFQPQTNKSANQGETPITVFDNNTDDPMDMPPLVFVTDSEEDNGDDEEDDDVIFLSSENAETAAAAMPVIEICENVDVVAEVQTPRTTKAVTKNITIEKTTTPPKEKNKRKSTTPKPLRGATKAKQTFDTPRTRSKLEENMVRTRRSNAGKKINKLNNLKQGRKSLPTAKQQQKETPKSATRKQQLNLVATPKVKNALKRQTPKTQKQSPKAMEKITNEAKNSTPKNKKRKNQSIKLEPVSPLYCEVASTAAETACNKKNSNTIKRNSSKTPKEVGQQRYNRRIPTPMRETRNMQRSTRLSGGHRKFLKLDFDDDSKHAKTKRKAKLKPKPAAKKLDKSQKVSTNVEIPKPSPTPPQEVKKIGKQNKKQNEVTELNEKPAAKKATKSNATPLSAPSTNSTQCSILPASSDYEEIQCGQKLIYSSSTDNTPPTAAAKAMEKASVEFLMPSTPPSFRLNGSGPLATFNDSDSDVAIVLPTKHRRSQSRKTKSNTATESVIVVISSSLDETSQSSQASSIDQQQRQLQQQRRRHQRRTLANAKAAGDAGNARKRKRASPPTNTVKDAATFGELLAKQRKSTKSPDLFSLGSDIGGGICGTSNNLPFSQSVTGVAKGSQAASATPPIFGFKIFGSEVRGFQASGSSLTATPTTTTKTTRSKRNAHSCLNILERMFETQETTTMNAANDENKKANNQKLKAKNNLRKSHGNPPQIQTQQPTPRKSIHESDGHELQQQNTTNASEDIFEITNNATFGSTLRISAGGHISPVAASIATPINNNTKNTINNYSLQQQLHAGNNKITNYLTGSGEQQYQQQSTILSASGGFASMANGTQSHQRKSPKSAKLTQTTKLTKWFRRSSIDESSLNRTATVVGARATTPANADILTASAKLVKRRRLDLSMKS